MRLIAHRGNVTGPNPSKENHPDYIENAISIGYDVEVDIWYDTFENNFYLGHDNPQYIITSYWLAHRIDKLWIHCKNIDALHYFVAKTGGYNYFWHQNDDFTLTSKKYIWTYPGKPYTSLSVIVMPELNNFDWDTLKVVSCHGVCTDYVEKLT